jgi:CRP-like cAMP-binding protein
MESLELTLSHHPFLADLTRGQLEQVARCAEIIQFPAGQFVFRSGDDATHFYILTSGAVAVEVDVPGRPPLVINTLGPNDELGWSWFYPPYRWHFDAWTLTPVDAIAFDATALVKLCNADHDLGYKLTRSYSHLLFERLQATRLQLLDVYGDTRRADLARRAQLAEPPIARAG